MLLNFASKILCQLSHTYKDMTLFSAHIPKCMLQFASEKHQYIGVAFIHEVFHVCLNKFENAVTHLFLVIFGNN